MSQSYSIYNMNPVGEFGTHRDYTSREECVHFDDTSLEDQWQDEVYSYSKSKFSEMSLKTVIDYGCGSGFKLNKYFGSCNTIGIEVEPALSFLKSKYVGKQWISGDDVDLSQMTADMLICSDVIEHMIDPCELLRRFASSNCKIFIISTPALELMSERGLSPRMGPPRNECHIREWTTPEFNNLVSRFLRVIDHKITNLMQYTQMIAAVKQ